MVANFLTTFSNAFPGMEIYKFYLRFHCIVPKGPVDNIPALVQIMAWCRPGDKPLSETMMVSLMTHIYVTRPLWVKSEQSMTVCKAQSTRIHNTFLTRIIFKCYLENMFVSEWEHT